MGQVLLHKRATTTAEVRRKIQHSKESLIKTAKCFGINPKTVFVWRKRDFVEDLPMGPKVIRSRSLTQAGRKICLEFHRLTQLPLDDCLYALQETIPHLSRSGLHRLFRRHGCSVL